MPYVSLTDVEQDIVAWGFEGPNIWIFRGNGTAMVCGPDHPDYAEVTRRAEAARKKRGRQFYGGLVWEGELHQVLGFTVGGKRIPVTKPK